MYFKLDAYFGMLLAEKSLVNLPSLFEKGLGLAVGTAGVIETTEICQAHRIVGM